MLQAKIYYKKYNKINLDNYSFKQYNSDDEINYDNNDDDLNEKNIEKNIDETNNN